MSTFELSGHPYQTSANVVVPNATHNDSENLSGLLEIFVHQAQNIHNICIYDDQDVYAKFSLTCNPDEIISTGVVKGGGKNPIFNEKLALKVDNPMDSVLKCEIWMFSRAKNLMEDQLLGFALVPVYVAAGKGKATQEFSLSSTDLFHSPAGTIRLSLSLDTDDLPLISATSQAYSNVCGRTSISSEVILLDRNIATGVSLDPVEYSRIEFPDINVVHENRQMVSEYFSLAGPDLKGPCSFLHLGTSMHPHEVDSEMNLYSFKENNLEAQSVSPSGSIRTTGLLSSTTTSLSDDNRNIKFDPSVLPGETNQSSSGTSPKTPTSKKNVVGDQVGGRESDFSNPMEKMSIDAEQLVIQQQIVDMYMKSMQQFTESLAKMKLPMDLGSPRIEMPENATNQRRNTIKDEKPEVDTKKKDGSRVFYGSRAFF